ncbi:MAG: histidine kinase [Cyanobacteria bacterium K_Offshore_surface_m2_239]|nr:histidine kinase [Cyanobacteria bacterium K_Offshore_surface_m2_239]
MANPVSAEARRRLAIPLRPLGYGAAAAGFTALGLLLLHLPLAQRLERQQRRQLANQVSATVLLSQVALERASPSELAELMGTAVAVGSRPPWAVTPARPASSALRRQAEALRDDLCRKLTSCPQVWPAQTAAPGGPGRGAWVQLNSSLETTTWLFAPIPALRGWPPDPQLLSLAVAFGGLAALLLFLSLEVQRPLRQLDAALEGVGLDAVPGPVPARGTASMRHLTAHFNAMLDRLRQASQERSTMLAGIAHDLRAPLTRLRLRLAQSTPWSAEERARAERDLSALEAITAQFLLFVGAEGKEPPLPLPLDALVAEAANAIDRVSMDLESMERCVRPVALSRAVANLLRNAEDHGQPPVRLWLRTLPEEGFAILVGDGGAGLSAATWERAKQPFQRLDPARGGLGHSGLGLAIAEQVARAHGGTLSCRQGTAAEGGGFVVVLTGHSLPLI